MDLNCCSIEFRCTPDKVLAQRIVENLPTWKSVVVEAEVNEANLEQIRFFIAALTPDEIKTWLKQFQKKTKRTYNIRTTYNNYNGTNVKFKQILHCQHNMRNPSLSNRAKNTNCKSKITITLHSGRALVVGRTCPNAQYPCEVIFIMSHNHAMSLVEDSKIGSASKEVREKLVDLYKRGHSPATALEMLKTDIYLNCDNYETILSDKYHCPDYRFCSYVYNKEFKSKHGTIDFNKNRKEFLVNKIQEFNKKQQTTCVEVFFSEQDYAISICQPLLKRTHMYAPSEAIFINSFGGVSNNGIGIFVLSTYIDCLPLGIIITSGDDTNLFCNGLQLLHNLLGSDIFGGDTPTICVVDDFTLEMTAIDQVWPKAKCYLSIFHVLQTTWRWITSSKHRIPHELHNEFYDAFKKMLYSQTEIECNTYYKEAYTKARRYSNYRKYLEHYWEKRELWVSYYRDKLSALKNYSTCSEIVNKLLKDKFFQKAKAFNVEQLVDYVLTMFVRYYEIHLLEVAKTQSNILGMGKLIEMPPLNLIEKIAQHDSHIVVVPSGEQDKLLYTVNPEVLICSCSRGSKGLLCRHTEWACAITHSEEYNSKVNIPSTQCLFYKIATGQEPPQDFLVQENIIDADCTSIDLSPIDEEPCDLDEDYRISQEYIIEQISSEAALLDGQDIIKQMSLQMTTFLRASSQDVLPALKLLSQKINECQTTSDFVSMCHSFGKGGNIKRGNDDVELGVSSQKRQLLEIEHEQPDGEHLETNSSQSTFLVFELEN